MERIEGFPLPETQVCFLLSEIKQKKKPVMGFLL